MADSIDIREKSRSPASEQAHLPEAPSDRDYIGAQVTATIDGRSVKVPSGTTLLEAASRLGIRIPTLCQHDDLCLAGVCRICVVDIEGQRALQAACSYPITAPIQVHTHTPRVRRARQHILALLLTKHYGQCYRCVRNGNCELQTLARDYGVNGIDFGLAEQPLYAVDDSSPSIIRDMDKCILCRRCVRTCTDLLAVGVLTVAGRGADSRIETFLDRPLGEVVCISCGQCITRCPTGALREQDSTQDVWDAIDDPQKHVVIQTAPASRAGISEEFGVEPCRALTFEMNTVLRQCGFDRVFDTNFTAELAILEEGTELLQRLHRALVDKDETAALPQLRSCSPGWIKYIEHFYPEYLANVSTCKSPEQMFGAVFKTYYAEQSRIDPADIVSVSLMPCTAKKMECNRPEMTDSGHKDIDYVLTTRELARMIKQAGIDLPDTPKSDFDDPFGSTTGSGVIFAPPGGVMESALRSVIELVTGMKVDDLFEHAEIIPARGVEEVRHFELPITDVGPVPVLLAGLFENWSWLRGVTLKVAICHGTANAKKVMEDIRAGGRFSEYHFIEFMACPGGCLGGGGQPIPTSPEIRAARARAIYAEDRAYTVRKSHENPAVLTLYGEFLKDGPCGHRSHELLHTSYAPRGKSLV